MKFQLENVKTQTKNANTSEELIYQLACAQQDCDILAFSNKSSYEARRYAEQVLYSKRQLAKHLIHANYMY
jgi:hypothetical protein